MPVPIPAIPTPQELRRFMIGRPGAGELLSQPLYDRRAYAQAGQNSLSFFQVPFGQVGDGAVVKTKRDTNMDAPGQVSQPKAFLLKGIRLTFIPGVAASVFGAQAVAAALNDAQAIWEGGYLEIKMQGKELLTVAPLGQFPSGKNLAIQSAGSDTSTIAADKQLRNAYPAFAGMPFKLEVPIGIPPGQNFAVNLVWPAAVAISAAGSIYIHLDGLLYLNS